MILEWGSGKNLDRNKRFMDSYSSQDDEAAEKAILLRAVFLQQRPCRHEAEENRDVCV